MVESEIREALDRLVNGFLGPTPLPAGGAAGIAAIAMGAAIGAKVARISQSHSRGTAESSLELEELARKISPEFDRDCAAFAQLLNALKTPKDTPDRAETIRDRWLAAVEAPVRVTELADEADRLLEDLTDSIKASLRGDLEAARVLIRAGRHIAASNARENAQHLPSEMEKALLSRRPPPA